MKIEEYDVIEVNSRNLEKQTVEINRLEQSMTVGTGIIAINIVLLQLMWLSEALKNIRKNSHTALTYSLLKGFAYCLLVTYYNLNELFGRTLFKNVMRACLKNLD